MVVFQVSAHRLGWTNHKGRDAKQPSWGSPGHGGMVYAPPSSKAFQRMFHCPWISTRRSTMHRTGRCNCQHQNDGWHLKTHFVTCRRHIMQPWRMNFSRIGTVRSHHHASVPTNTSSDEGPSNRRLSRKQQASRVDHADDHEQPRSAVAQFPHELITYGGNGSVFQNWAQYRLTMQYLATMTDDQCLPMYSGHPLGLFPAAPNSPQSWSPMGW